MTHRRAAVAGLFLLALRPRLAEAAIVPWFDPTQLPSYTGRLERWVTNPAGQVDRGLFREGSQFVFPSAEGGDLVAAIAPGGPLTVWGIRARSAPVITMMAWAPGEQQPATFVERPAWFADTAAGRDVLTVTGRIVAPMLTPQGEAMGVILSDGGAVRMPVAAHKALGNRLNVGETIVARGRGTRTGALVCIDAETIGASADSLQPLPDAPR